MKKTLFFILLSAIICSCNPIPNKPFYEPLTLEELAKAIKADEYFGEWYEELADDSDVQRMTDVEKAKYKDVTYRRLYKYFQYQDDFQYWIKQDSISQIKWFEEYASTIKSMDSLIAVQKELKEQTFAEVNKIASFELTGVNRKWETRGEWVRRSYGYGNLEWVEKDEQYIELVFNCNFSVPEISKIEAVLYCWGKDGYPRVEDFSYFNGENLKNGKVWKRSFYRVPDFFKNHTGEKFFNECDYEIRINKIIIGKDTITSNYSGEFALVKYDISKYGDDWLRLAKSKFNPDIVSQWEYSYGMKKKALQKFDPLIYEMIDEIF